MSHNIHYNIICRQWMFLYEKKSKDRQNNDNNIIMKYTTAISHYESRILWWTNITCIYVLYYIELAHMHICTVVVGTYIYYSIRNESPIRKTYKSDYFTFARVICIFASLVRFYRLDLYFEASCLAYNAIWLDCTFFNHIILYKFIHNMRWNDEHIV